MEPARTVMSGETEVKRIVFAGSGGTLTVTIVTAASGIFVAR
jgi:hypothetical protein